MTDWVAVGPSSWWGTAWVADMGYWVGPDQISVQTRPADAAGVDYWLAVMGNGGVQTGGIVGFYAFAQRFLTQDGTEATYTASAAVVDSEVDVTTARLYVVWYGPDHPSDPATMAAPSVTPDALIPAQWISNTAPPPPPPPPTPPEARPEVVLFDVDGTFLAELPFAAGIQWQDQLSAPGALSVRLPLDDPATALATPRCILRVYWRGAHRQAARIDSSSTDVVIDGRMWREWANLPGLLSLLGEVPVYPEYGLNHTSNTSRTFGYMSRFGHGIWLESAGFTPAAGVKWSQMTGARAGRPEGLDFPDPMWIAKRGPNADEPALSYQWFRRMFYTDTSKQVQILATGDNRFDLWLDGEQLIDSHGQDQFTWREANQITMTLPPSPVGGRHMLAARVRNNRDTANGQPNHMGLLFTMQEVDNSGNVIEQPPLINSDEDWIVANVAPGFRKADVLTRLWSEGNLYGYNATGLIGQDYTITLDSDDNPWDDAPGEYTFDVGSSILDVLAVFSEKDVDVAIDPYTLKLQMWNRRGADHSSTVQLKTGRRGGNLISHQVVPKAPEFNTVLLQLGDGRWMQRQNAARVTADGRAATGLSMGSTSDGQSARQLADAQLVEMSETSVTFATQISTLIGPQPYIDFNNGDTIAVPNEGDDGYYAVRVLSLTVDASNDGAVHVTAEVRLDRSAAPPVVNDSDVGTNDPGDYEAT